MARVPAAVFDAPFSLVLQGERVYTGYRDPDVDGYGDVMVHGFGRVPAREVTARTVLVDLTPVPPDRRGKLMLRLPVCDLRLPRGHVRLHGSEPERFTGQSLPLIAAAAPDVIARLCTDAGAHITRHNT